MKNLTLSIVLFLATFVAFGQQGINYQAVVRDGSGALLTNQAVTINFKVLQGSATGTVLYEEDHNPTTNNYGLANVVIGQGTVVSGTLNSIDWGADLHFLDITIDGNNLGAIEFQAVPYSYHADAMTHVRPDVNSSDLDITSDDDFARVSIRPTANGTNDSTELFLGEGSTPENGMRLTYDGVQNALKISGGTFAQPYMGPYLSIDRDSGTSTFSNGVEVEETTNNPAPNRTYGNSGPLAYGYFSGTNITTDYGITSITSSATGVYEVTLDNSWQGSPVVVATSLNNTSDTETITYNTTGGNLITIRIVDENNNPIASNFSLVVYGIAQ